MNIKLVAKEDGLWLSLSSNKTKRYALINLNAKGDKIGIVNQVCSEVWDELKLEERRKKIASLSDRKLCLEVLKLSDSMIPVELKWILEHIIERFTTREGIDLDEEEDEDS